MIRSAIALSALAILLGATSNAQARTVATACPGHVQGVYYYRDATRRWERKLGKNPTRSSFNASMVRSCQYVVWVAHLWANRAAKTRDQYAAYLKRQAELRAQQARQAQGALTSDWACIHSHEGAWNANTGNGYYGGLQMDLTFQSQYGGEFVRLWGTADNWPVWAQITAANRAKNGGRGYGPWPNTARMCGLL